MNFKKFLSLLCAITMLFSSTFCCKAAENYKVIFFGNERTGKTQIVRKLCGDPFEEEYEQTLGATFCNMQLNDKTYQIWDPSGQEKFKFLVKLYTRNSKLGVFVCDLNNQKTIDSFGDWIQIYKDNASNNNVILVGNKSDLISSEELEAKNKL